MQLRTQEEFFVKLVKFDVKLSSLGFVLYSYCRLKLPLLQRKRQMTIRKSTRSFDISSTNLEDRIVKLEKACYNTDDRICVFLDNTSIFNALKEYDDQRLNYKILSEFLADGREMDGRFYYGEPPTNWTSSDISVSNRLKFNEYLQNVLSFTMIPISLRSRNTAEGEKLILDGIDCAIAYDMAKLQNRYQTYILVSGNEAFVPVLRNLRNDGIRVEVAFFSDQIGWLQRESHQFLPLENVENIFL